MFPVLPYGFPTPDSLPEETVCRTLTIPNETVFLACFMGALRVLAEAENWQQTGSITPEEAAAAAFEIIDQAYNSNICPADTIDTPFWDDNTDVDDEMSLDDQTWYGTVSDPEAPPDELDFVENAAIWALTGFLAIATIELAAAPAILFHTIAPKFVLATRRGDLGEIIRILVDGEEAARVDTSAAAPGDIINTTILADPDLESHDIMLVQVS